MKFDEKLKKHLILGGGAVICAALVATIGMQFMKFPTQSESISSTDLQRSEVTVVGSEKEKSIQPTEDDEEEMFPSHANAQKTPEQVEKTIAQEKPTEKSGQIDTSESLALPELPANSLSPDSGDGHPAKPPQVVTDEKRPTPATSPESLQTPLPPMPDTRLGSAAPQMMETESDTPPTGTIPE